MSVPGVGSVLVFKVAASTLGDFTYERGDKLTLLSPTEDAPFGHSSGICNWNVRCKHMESSVWSSIWWLLDNSMLKQQTL